MTRVGCCTCDVGQLKVKKREPSSAGFSGLPALKNGLWRCRRIGCVDARKGSEGHCEGDGKQDREGGDACQSAEVPARIVASKLGDNGGAEGVESADGEQCNDTDSQWCRDGDAQVLTQSRQAAGVSRIHVSLRIDW